MYKITKKTAKMIQLILFFPIFAMRTIHWTNNSKIGRRYDYETQTQNAQTGRL